MATCAVMRTRYRVCMSGMDRIGNLAQKQIFRIELQREFMLQALHNEHDREKEMQWVTENATPFAVWFKRENKDGRLERERAAATTEEASKKLIGVWLSKMHEFAASKEYRDMPETEKEAA